MPLPALRLGTRGSALARIQSGLIAAALRALGVDVELVPIVTEGDVRPPDTAWGEGAFVGALETALIDGRIDLAVHSAKDVPIGPDDGDEGAARQAAPLEVAAYPTRADARDALVLRDGRRIESLDALPRGFVVGTDSPRRTGFILAARPDLRVVPLHGNVDTRLRRLDEGQVDCLVLAVAGLTRLGRSDRISLVLEPELVAPAPGQGALAVQVRRDDRRAFDLVARLEDPSTRLAVTTERALLQATGGGCRAPIGALAVVREEVSLVAAAVEPDGSNRRLLVRSAPRVQAEAMARALGAELVGAAVVEVRSAG